MLESLLPYYERELGYLRELSGEFARRYPKIAGRLQLEGDQCEDPHTERLIEAFAFLAARIHRKIDDEYPEIASSFLEVLYPHYLRPIPALTIVQLECDPQRPEIAKRYTVERHHPVHAPAIQGVVCKFRTCYPVDLYPLSLSSARLELTSGSAHLRRLAPDAAAVLTLEFETHGDLDISQIGLDALRLFLDGEPALMHLLYELLLSHTLRVRVGDGHDDPTATRELPGSMIQPVGFGRDEGVLEYDERSFLGYRLLTEYFSFPDKFLFIDFTRLGQVASRLSGNRLVLQCMIGRYPDTERHERLLNHLGPQHFKLGCTPIVNLFSQAGEPIRVTHQRASYPVWIDSRKQLAFEVIQIKRVVRVEKTGNDEQSEEVLPFYAIRHGGAEDAPRFYWHASREMATRQDDKGTDVELHLVDLAFNPVRPAAEVLSLEILCSNRDLPEQIPFGGSQGGLHTDFMLPGHSVVKRVRLLRKPTGSLRPPQRRGLQWRLISHLSLNYLSIVESGKSALQEMLALYNFTDSPVTNRQIQGIAGISSKPAVTRVAGRDFAGFVRGTEILLTLDEDYYVGGSVYLFASVLERFFALYCAPNSFTKLCVKSAQQHAEEIAVWPARSGEALVI
ncbi:type VI secretion system baseplate subunit TssF [Chitiniphilus purpureus]|uniref:Type VI secretion system baseplate subunit TssF n=1 Tax=Chitiniphilus purpureus TaxID=2981137 RepID=A0ABY6DJN2_9NEIS|nr:type VI secretion system baseplate subunit TssF [Chitiniphilus sp. CD1]UXY14565.1 type VI secretion system baseplate subunit TssF [Chitiniphilus sp. CD1]